MVKRYPNAQEQKDKLRNPPLMSYLPQWSGRRAKDINQHNSQSLGSNRFTFLTVMVDIRFRVVGYSLLEKVGLALQRNHVHKVEWVGHVIDLLIPQ